MTKIININIDNTIFKIETLFVINILGYQLK